MFTREIDGDRDTIRILYVDDDSSLCNLVKTFLERDNPAFSVIPEPTAVAGLEQLKHRAIDCIVSEYKSPNTDGLEFLRTVRTEYAALPFILYTGKDSEDIVE